MCKVWQSFHQMRSEFWLSTQRRIPRLKFNRSSKLDSGVSMTPFFFFFFGTDQRSPVQLPLLLLNLIDNQLSTQRGERNHSANELPALLSLEECSLTGTQLKGDWFIEPECSGPLISASLRSCNHHFQTRISLRKRKRNWSWWPGSQRCC